MKTIWKPSRSERLGQFVEPLSNLLAIGALLWFTWHIGKGDTDEGQSDWSATFVLSPILIMFSIDAAIGLLRFYATWRRRMFDWSMTFDGETLSILRPDEQPLSIRKSDCARLYPLSGKLILRDGRAVHLCTPDERLPDCTQRAFWLRQWWPELRGVGLDTKRRSTRLDSNATNAAIMAAIVVALCGIFVFSELVFDNVWVLLLMSLLYGVTLQLPKALHWTDWHQQPIDLDELEQEPIASGPRPQTSTARH